MKCGMHLKSIEENMYVQANCHDPDGITNFESVVHVHEEVVMNNLIHHCKAI